MNLIADRNTKQLDQIFIIIIAGLLYLPYLGGLNLFDWDEINFAEMAREMILLKDYLHLYINFEAFYEKPPLFIWMQALSMHLWGINEYAARFPDAVCGIITHVVIYRIGLVIYNRKIGLLWTFIYAGSILPHWYFKSGIIDPWFNLFIFLGIYFLIQYYWKSNTAYTEKKQHSITLLLLAGLFTGLGILTKGPVAYLITGIVCFVYWVYVRFRFYIAPWAFILYSIASIAVVCLWLSVEVSTNGSAFLKEFFIRNYELMSQHDAGHKGFIGYHLVVFLLGTFPASFFCLRALKKTTFETAIQNNFRIWMIILSSVVLVVFSLVQTKIIHYSSLMYIPATFLAATTVYHILEGNIKYPRWISVCLLTVGILLATGVSIIPFVGMRIAELSPLIKDQFTQGNLEATVHWTGFESIVGIVMLCSVVVGVYYLQKQQSLRGILILFGGTALTVQLIMYIFLNNVEAYTQRAAIDFFKNLKGKDCYVLNVNYKSYAPLFYFDKPIPTNPNSLSDDWLLTGPIDKDLYIITKINELEDVQRKTKDNIVIGKKNGFVFLLRKAVAQ